MIVYADYNDPRAVRFLSERVNIPSVMLPFTVGGTDKAKDLFGLFDDTIERLLDTATHDEMERLGTRFVDRSRLDQIKEGKTPSESHNHFPKG